MNFWVTIKKLNGRFKMAIFIAVIVSLSLWTAIQYLRATATREDILNSQADILETQLELRRTWLRSAEIHKDTSVNIDTMKIKITLNRLYEKLGRKEEK